jgi:hypothetical protein
LQVEADVENAELERKAQIILCAYLVDIMLQQHAAGRVRGADAACFKMRVSPRCEGAIHQADVGRRIRKKPDHKHSTLSVCLAGAQQRSSAAPRDSLRQHKRWRCRSQAPSTGTQIQKRVPQIPKTIAVLSYTPSEFTEVGYVWKSYGARGELAVRVRTSLQDYRVGVPGHRHGTSSLLVDAKSRVGSSMLVAEAQSHAPRV